MATLTPPSSLDDSSSHCKLPFELERSICEIAASNFPSCIPHIILVARRFRIWFEPALYRILRSGGARVIPPLYHTKFIADDTCPRPVVLDLPRISVFGHHVQHVLLQSRGASEIAEILKCCPNTTNLALWIVHGSCTPLIPILDGLPLCRLSIDPTAFFPNYSRETGIPFDRPMFLNLTHLEIINATLQIWSKWQQVALLPKLTHLALRHTENQEFIKRILQECPRLELLVMTLPENKTTVPLMHVQTDERVVVLLSVWQRVKQNLMEHWERGARGEEDFWITAELEKKRRK